jgi:hypothetical protein
MGFGQFMTQGNDEAHTAEHLQEESPVCDRA